MLTPVTSLEAYLTDFVQLPLEPQSAFYNFFPPHMYAVVFPKTCKQTSVEDTIRHIGYFEDWELFRFCSRACACCDLTTHSALRHFLGKLKHDGICCLQRIAQSAAQTGE